MGVHVPHDLVSNYILPRVPAKSVCRFKCVSKEWHSLLMSDVFQSKHNRLHVGDHNNNLRLLFLSKINTSFEFTTIDCEALPSDKHLTPARRPLPPFEGITPVSIRILASLHGLVCLGINKMGRRVFSHLILWNPLTNEYKVLPKLCNYVRYSYSVIYGLYYSCEDDYKFLFVDFFYNNVYIYSLKSDSLRNVDDAFQRTEDRQRWLEGYWNRGTYLNENLYFLQQSYGRVRSIIRFDTKTEVLSKIETPNMHISPYANNYFATIMVKSDCIHVFVKYDPGKSRFERTCIKLWKLDEYENLKEVLSYHLLKPYDHTIRWLDPFHLMKNGNWLMIRNDDEGRSRIYKVDLKEKKRIKNKRGKDKGNIYDDHELYPSVRLEAINVKFVDKFGYIETFVSPNLYE